MSLINIDVEPRAYIFKHEEELRHAFSVGMKAQKIYTALEESVEPPPMSYRQFCRFTKHMRNASTPPGSFAPDGATDPVKVAGSYTRGEGGKPNLRIPKFIHHRDHEETP